MSMLVSTRNIKEGPRVPVREPAGKIAGKFAGQAVDGPGDEGVRTVGIPKMEEGMRTGETVEDCED